MGSIHTDMALEAHEYYSVKKGGLPEGITISGRNFGGLKYTGITISDKEGAEYLEKPIGTYITFESEDLRGSAKESFEQNRQFIANEISSLLEKNHIAPEDSVLVVGLGNWDITPDALGPKTTSALFVSRHLFEHIPGLSTGHIRPVSALSPGVLGTTGIETLEIVKGIVQRTTPKCVIAIDSLVARNINRLGKSLQISDSGINPGSGVGNHRMGLNYETLGVPVISIGIPTVVSAATVAENVFEYSAESLKSHAKDHPDFYTMLSDFTDSERKELFTEALKDLNGELIVTPKDIDEMISDLSEVIASALNIGLHPRDTNKLFQ